MLGHCWQDITVGGGRTARRDNEEGLYSDRSLGLIFALATWQQHPELNHCEGGYGSRFQRKTSAFQEPIHHFQQFIETQDWIKPNLAKLEERKFVVRLDAFVFMNISNLRPFTRFNTSICVGKYVQV